MDDTIDDDNVPLQRGLLHNENEDSVPEEEQRLLDQGSNTDASQLDTTAPAPIDTSNRQATIESSMPSPRRFPRQPLLQFDAKDNIHQLERELEQRQTVGSPHQNLEAEDDLVENAIPSTIGGSLDKMIGSFIRGIGHLTKDPELVSIGDQRILIGNAEIEQKKRERQDAATETVAIP
ncbi:hypothetical protein K450DRAFT_217316 [Umbelopsis ramanniana AG]|uniref:Uncharacterized protein n=1 Tax=Umbelopsis ramanniana AG TaxID=1314678 RepID=A0AAD5EJQ5_UMBRA|nr:uncharacterized protein K450DRAFT_217316 [Umbelopsis ramanniana AG]KAI8584652.1 hypothetical protein K450DRAFT_217316 [Umbelopsis ramanniana AG]